MNQRSAGIGSPARASPSATGRRKYSDDMWGRNQFTCAGASERFAAMWKAGEAHPASPSMMKYAGTELNKRRHELIVAAGGSDALEWESDRSRKGKAAREWLRTKANSIEGGTSEIQLGIVAKRILDLPGA